MNGKILDLTADEWIGMYHIAADRADKAEGDLKRLQKSYAITNESWQRLKEENTLLRKVADAARAAMPAEQYQYSQSIYKLEQALAELDEEPSHD